MSVKSALLLSGGAGLLAAAFTLPVTLLIDAWPPRLETEIWVFFSASAVMLVWLIQIAWQERQK